LLPWLEYQLKGNCSQGNFFDNQIVADTTINYLKNCTLCNPLDTGFLNEKGEIYIYPNPVPAHLNIEGNLLVNYQLKVYDMHSRLLIESNFVQQTSMNTTNWDSGIYLYEIKFDDKIKKGKLIKL
jgi:hypothetical protein